MPCSTGLRTACRKLPAWAVSVEQLQSLNRCNELQASNNSFSRLLDERSLDKLDRFRLSDPRLQESFSELSTFAQFGLLFQVIPLRLQRALWGAWRCLEALRDS